MYKKTSAVSIEEYIKMAPEPQQPRLNQIYNLIKEVLPEREEKISYDMPTFKYKGNVLIYFAAQKHHIGLYALPETNIKFADSLSITKLEKEVFSFLIMKNYLWL